MNSLPLTYNTLIVLTGTSLLGACAGLVGSYAVLRRRALVGDAISHAALPGLCLSFLVLGHRSLPAMLCGAFASGVLGVGVVAFLRWATRIKEDAAIGIVLSTFFGAGYVLSQLIQQHVTSGSKAGLDSYILGKTAGMIYSDVVLIGGVAALCLLIVVVLYKEFKVVSFDPGFARVQGWPATLMDLLLMTLVAVTVVIGLPAVGVVLMSALLIIPGAAARFWTDRLGKLLGLSALFGGVIGGVGTLMSAQFSWSPAGPVIVLVGTGVFLVSMLVAPSRGAVARFVGHYRFRQQVRQQNMLRLAYQLTEDDSREVFTLTDIMRHSSEPVDAARQILSQLGGLNWITSPKVDNYRLTDAGRRRAAELERGFRLWETFLTEHADLAGSYLDLDAESVDRVLSPQMVAELEQLLQARGRWPRGLAHSSGAAS
ncbi:MAG: metal ABC transporter permease [Planctomycetaceae bacterium]|nr:metal ABC transporter permease [Planctomycetaceae bacterium]